MDRLLAEIEKQQTLCQQLIEEAEGEAKLALLVTQLSLLGQLLQKVVVGRADPVTGQQTTQQQHQQQQQPTRQQELPQSHLQQAKQQTTEKRSYKEVMGSRKNTTTVPTRSENPYAPLIPSQNSKKGWSKAKRPPPSLRQADWDSPIVSEDDFMAGKVKTGVVLITNSDYNTALGVADQMKKFDPTAKYAIVSKGRITEQSAKKPVPHSRGCDDWYVTDVGINGPKTASVETGGGDEYTTVVVGYIPTRLASESAQMALKCDDTGAAATDKLCRFALESVGVKSAPQHRFAHAKAKGRSELKVRIGSSEAPKVLQSSGIGGIFWRMTGEPSDTVIWLNEETPLEAAVQLGNLSGAYGLVAGNRRLGVRCAPGLTPQQVQSLTEQIGPQAAPPKSEWPKRFTVSGAHVKEHAHKILGPLANHWKFKEEINFAKDGKRVCIVTADEAPPNTLISRPGLASLLISPTKNEDFHGSKKKFWDKPVKPGCIKTEVLLPRKTEMPEPPKAQTGGTKKRKSDDILMDMDHTHDWAPHPQKSSAEWICSLCMNKKTPDTLYSPCGKGCRRCPDCAQRH